MDLLIQSNPVLKLHAPAVSMTCFQAGFQESSKLQLEIPMLVTAINASIVISCWPQSMIPFTKALSAGIIIETDTLDTFNGSIHQDEFWQGFSFKKNTVNT